MNTVTDTRAPASEVEKPTGRNCPACKHSDSWGIPDRACSVACQPTADGKGRNFVPLNATTR